MPGNRGNASFGSAEILRLIERGLTQFTNRNIHELRYQPRRRRIAKAAFYRFLNIWAQIRTSQFWIVASPSSCASDGSSSVTLTSSRAPTNNFGFGWEMGRIAAAIASGRGFSDPLGAATGPTAWEPPLYPYLTAGVFHHFWYLFAGVGFRAAFHQ